MTERSIKPDDRGLLLTCPKCGRRNRMVYARLGIEARFGREWAVLHPKVISPVSRKNLLAPYRTSSLLANFILLAELRIARRELVPEGTQ